MKYLKNFESVFFNSHPIKMIPKDPSGKLIGPDPPIPDSFLFDEWINKHGNPSSRNEYNKMIDYIRIRRKQIRDAAEIEKMKKDSGYEEPKNTENPSF